MTGSESQVLKYTTYTASYNISLYQVERPVKATERYGIQNVDTILGNSKYKFSFEDDMVKILLFAGSRDVTFSLENKTEHSIKIPWDEAAFVDETGRSHRVMHSGVKYTDKEKPQAPSIVVRKGIYEDIISAADYVHWDESGGNTAGRWAEDLTCPRFMYQPEL